MAPPVLTSPVTALKEEGNTFLAQLSLLSPKGAKNPVFFQKATSQGSDAPIQALCRLILPPAPAFGFFWWWVKRFFSKLLAAW